MRDSIGRNSGRTSKVMQQIEEIGNKEQPTFLINDFRSMVLNNAKISVEKFVSRQNSD